MFLGIPTRAAVTLFALAALGCDKFLSANLTVGNCDDGRPIGGARVFVTLDKGMGEEPKDLSTDANGRVNVFLNEPRSSWATIRVSKKGFRPGTWTLHDAWHAQMPVCLEPAPAASTGASTPR